MYLCDITLIGLGAVEEAVSLAHELASSLGRNGQILGEHVVGRRGDDLRLTCTLPLPDSLSPEHQSQYVRGALERLVELSGQPVTTEVGERPVGGECHHLASYGGVELLVLKTSYTSLVSPLWDPKTDQHLPLYQVPISPDGRERLFLWELNYKRLEGIWFSGWLEAESYREMAIPSSSLMVAGKEHAACVEAATGVPTYVWLAHHYGAPVDHEQRPCPGCGATWRSSPGDPLAKVVPFRCEPCRLVSHVAFCTDAPPSR